MTILVLGICDIIEMQIAIEADPEPLPKNISSIYTLYF